MDQKKFNRKEISQILKIAAELDQQRQDEEGLTEEELRGIAKEVGLEPVSIETAIHQLQEYPDDLTEFDSGHTATFRRTLVLDGQIDDSLWEDLVTEIRRINGGIGKTSRLGNTYEWEQRRKNVGYLQVSVTPKGEKTRIRINAGYGAFSTMLGFIGGVTGFTLLAVLSDGVSALQNLEFIMAGLGAVGGWGLSRWYLTGWLREKHKMLSALSRRLAQTFTGNPNHPSEETTGEASAPEISLDRERETETSSGDNRHHTGEKPKTR